MGGRGAAASGRIPEDNRHWEQIPSNSETGRSNEIDGVKILRSKDVSNARIPIESNTPDTTYIVANRKGEISYIAEYENNHIKVSVDILEDGTSHMHYWEDGRRKSHSKANEHPTAERFKKLAKKCAEYNKKYFNK